MDERLPFTDVIELPVPLRSLPSAPGAFGDRPFRMLPILPNRAPNPLDALRAKFPGWGGGDMLPEEFLRGEVGADPLTSGNISFTGELLPEGVSRAACDCPFALGFTGNRGDTLRCLPCKVLGGAVMELRCDGRGLLGEEGSEGNAPGASSPGVAMGAVGVGGSTSRGGLFEVCRLSFC